MRLSFRFKKKKKKSLLQLRLKINIILLMISPVDSYHNDLSLKKFRTNDHDLQIMTEWVKIDERFDYKINLIRGFSKDHFGVSGTT